MEIISGEEIELGVPHIHTGLVVSHSIPPPPPPPPAKPSPVFWYHIMYVHVTRTNLAERRKGLGPIVLIQEERQLHEWVFPSHGTSLVQRPIVWINHTRRPADAVVVAAPILNEWLAKVSELQPASWRRTLSLAVRAVRVRNV